LPWAERGKVFGDPWQIKIAAWKLEVAAFMVCVAAIPGSGERAKGNNAASQA